MKKEKLQIRGLKPKSYKWSKDGDTGLVELSSKADDYRKVVSEYNRASMSNVKERSRLLDL